jgi:hypothetical protein
VWRIGTPRSTTFLDGAARKLSQLKLGRDPDCGTYNYTFNGGFFDRELRMSMRATSAVCYNFDLTISVFR